MILSKRNRPRRGVVLIAVLLCLAVISVVGALMVARAVETHRQARSDRDRLQAYLLAESGLQRAAVQLQTSTEYTGGTWTTELAGADRSAVVEIVVEATDVMRERRRVTVTARIGTAPHQVAAQRVDLLSINLRGGTP